MHMFFSAGQGLIYLRTFFYSLRAWKTDLLAMQSYSPIGLISEALAFMTFGLEDRFS